MDNFFRELSLYNEAMCVEHNWPCTRRFTHDELAPAIKAIREIESAKAAEINAIMLDAIGPKP